MTESKHISILDPMRGVAALAVVLFHYSGSILPSITPDLLTNFFSYGNLGVQVFFVISGFVIPFSLHRSGYTIRDLGNFMARRWVRIAPPAYVAACGMIAYYLIALKINNRPIEGWDFPGFGPRAILANLTFTAEYLNTTWYNFVYWTLTAEFEFYIFIGLTYPLLMESKRRWLSPAILLALMLVAQLGGPLFFRNAPYFVLGLMVFLNRVDRLDVPSGIGLAIVVGILGVVNDEVVATCVAFATTMIIISGVPSTSKVANWLGTISYSLYIIHVPVGNIAESVLRRVTDLHTSEAGKIILLFFYTALALIVSWFFYRYIERPFHAWSKVLKRSAPIASSN